MNQGSGGTQFNPEHALKTLNTEAQEILADRHHSVCASVRVRVARVYQEGNASVIPRSETRRAPSGTFLDSTLRTASLGRLESVSLPCNKP